MLAQRPLVARRQQGAWCPLKVDFRIGAQIESRRFGSWRISLRRLAADNFAALAQLINVHPVEGGQAAKGDKSKLIIIINQRTIFKWRTRYTERHPSPYLT